MKSAFPFISRAAAQKCSAFRRVFLDCHESLVPSMGTLFEEVIGCIALQDNNEVEVRRLRKNTESGVVEEEEGKRMKLFDGDEVEVRLGDVQSDWDELDRNVLLKPDCEAYPVVDLVASQRRGFNFTVAKRHAIRAKECLKLIEGKTIELYWVVPWYRFQRNFRVEQRFTGDAEEVAEAAKLVQQYAIKISRDQIIRALDTASRFENRESAMTDTTGATCT